MEGEPTYVRTYVRSHAISLCYGVTKIVSTRLAPINNDLSPFQIVVPQLTSSPSMPFADVQRSYVRTYVDCVGPLAMSFLFMPAQDTRVCGTLLCFVGVSDHLARLCLKDFTRLFVMPAFGTKSRLSNMLAARRAMALATCQLLVSDLDHAQRLRTSTSCILAGPLSPPAVPLLPLQAHVHT